MSGSDKDELICLLQYDNRTDERLGAQADLMNLNRELCDSLDNCNYHKIQEEAERPVYWEKVFRANKLMKDHPECDVVAYLDSDAHVRRGNVDFFSKMMGDKDFLSSDDVAFDFHGRKPFNAGVWAVRNTNKGRQIMNDWEILYEGSRWKKNEETGEWHCPKCNWAGSSYEQGSFSHVLKRHGGSIETVSYKELNNHRCNVPQKEIQASVCHFLGEKKEHIPDYIERFRQRK